MRYNLQFYLFLVVLVFLVIGCTAQKDKVSFEAVLEEQSDELERVESSAFSNFIVDSDQKLMVRGKPWLFDGVKTQYSSDIDGEIAFKFFDNSAIVHVEKKFQPQKGDTFVATLPLTQISGRVPGNVRVMLSRECSSFGEDSSAVIVDLIKYETMNLVVKHKFLESHGCLKMVVQILNADKVNAITVKIGDPSFTKI